MRHLARVLIAALLLAATAEQLPARDHDRARGAVQRGEALPLEQIMGRIAASHPGRLLDARLVERGGRLEYEIRLLQADGRVVELTVDARSGQVQRVRGGR
jgi:uncharacterized membrane protein YkoI